MDEMKAYKIVEEKYTNNYNELNDSLYHYLKYYLIDENYSDICMFQDEIENLIGIRNHEDIINYILKGGGR